MYGLNPFFIILRRVRLYLGINKHFLKNNNEFDNEKQIYIYLETHGRTINITIIIYYPNYIVTFFPETQGFIKINYFL